MYRYFLLATLLSFTAGSFSAYSMEEEPKGEGSSLVRRNPDLPFLEIHGDNHSPVPQLHNPVDNPTQEEEAETSPSGSAAASSVDETSVVPASTIFGNISSVIFFWQKSPKPEVEVNDKGQKLTATLLEDGWVLLDFPEEQNGLASSGHREETEDTSEPNVTSNSLAIVPYQGLDEEEAFPYPSLVSLTDVNQKELIALALLKNESLDRFEKMMAKHPDAPKTFKSGRVLYGSREAVRRHNRLLDMIDDTQEGINSGRIIPSSDELYYRKHLKKMAKAMPGFLLENFGPVLGYTFMRGIMNILLSERGLWLVQKFGGFTAGEASRLTTFLTKIDITGLTPWIATRFAESQARAEALRHLGDMAALVERHGLTVLLTSANLAVTTYDYTSSAVRGTYNGVCAAGTSTASGVHYLIGAGEDEAPQVIVEAPEVIDEASGKEGTQTDTRDSSREEDSDTDEG